MRSVRQFVQMVAISTIVVLGAAAARADHLHRATILDGMDVKNDKGEDLGRVFDLLINTHDGRVSYAAMSVGDKCFAIPLRAMRVGTVQNKPNAKVFLINADRSDFEKHLGFKKNQEWPTAPDLDLAKGFHLEAGPVRIDVSVDGKSAADKHNFRRATVLIGMAVKNRKGETLGTVRDLMINAKDERVAYVAVGHGGVVGVGERLFAAPWESAEVKSLTGSADECFIMNLEKTVFDKNPGFNKDSWPTEPDRALFGTETRPRT